MFEQLGLGVTFEFQNYGHSGLLDAMSDMNGLYDVARESGTVFGSLQENFEKTTGALEKYAKVAVATGSAMTFAFKKGIDSASEFESELAGLKKYMSDTSAEGIATFNKSLSASAQELGVAKTSIMEATQEYMAMGLAQDKALEMASAVTKAGKIWDVASQEAAEAFKGISAAYNMDFVNSEEVRTDFIDLINYVADNTALVGRDSLNFLSAAGASLKTMGNTSMEGALGIASAAAKAQVDITHLGYGMNTMIRRYADKGETYFKTVGLDAKDATGQLKPFNEMLDELSQKVKEGAVEQTALSEFASSLGGVYASDLLRIINAWDEYDKTMSAIASGDYAGSAQREWETITATFEHQANITKVIWSDFIQATFGQILPIVTKFVQGFNKAFSAITDFLSNHPKLSAFGTALFGISGIALILGGAFILLTTKVSKWMISLQVAQRAGYSFSGMLNVMKLHMSNFAKAIVPVGKQILGLGATLGLTYLVMKYDILGIRSMFEKFVGTIKNSFAESQNLIASSASNISANLQSLDNSSSFGDHLIAAFARVGIAWQALKDMWTDYTLSDELYEKLVASGMLPVVTSIMMLIYRLREAWRGFKDGFSGMCEAIRNVIQNVLAPPFNWLKEHIINPAIDAITDFAIRIGLISQNSSLLTSASSKWYAFGKAIGSIAPFVVLIAWVKKLIDYAGILKTVFGPLGKLLTAPFNLLKTAISKISFSGIVTKIGGLVGKIGTVFSTIGTKVTGAFGLIKGALMGILGAIGTVVTSILGAFGIVVTAPAWVVGAIAVAVVAAIGLIWHFRDEIMAFFSSIGEWIVDKWNQIWNADWFAPAREVITNVVEGIKEIFSPIVDFFNESWTAVCEFFKGIWDSTVGFAKGIWDDICADVSSMKDTLTGFWQEIKDGCASIWDNIKEKFQPVVDGFESVKTKAVEVWNAVLPVLQGIWNHIVTTFNNIWSFIQPILTVISTFFATVWGAIRDVVLTTLSGIWNTILNVLNGIWTAVSGVFMSIFNTIVSILSAIWNTIVGIVNTIVNFISGILQSVWSIISGVLDMIVGIFTLDLGRIWQGVQGIFSGIFSFVSTILQTLWGVISSILSGIAGVFSSIFNGIYNAVASIVSGLVSAVTGFFSGLWNTLVGIVTSIKNSVVNGFNAMKTAVSTAVSNIISNVTGKFTGLISNAVNWGKNLIGGFIDGIKSMASKAAEAASGVVNSVKGFLGFNSPAKKGEGRNIVKWGANMIGGFIDGVQSAIPSLNKVMSEVITAPNLNGMVSMTTGGDLSGGNQAYATPTDTYDRQNRETIKNIYNSRNETANNNYNSSNTQSDNGTSLVFNDGAFKFVFEGAGGSDVIDKMPEIQNMIQGMILETVKKLKSQQYER